MTDEPKCPHCDHMSRALPLLFVAFVLMGALAGWLLREAQKGGDYDQTPSVEVEFDEVGDVYEVSKDHDGYLVDVDWNDRSSSRFCMYGSEYERCGKPKVGDRVGVTHGRLVREEGRHPRASYVFTKIRSVK